MNLRKFYFLISSILLVFLFISGTVLLFQLKILKTSGSSTSVFGDNDIFSPFVNNKPMNILLLGGDYVNKNTDTMMILNYNPVKSKISVLSIPRDTKVKINERNKLILLKVQ